MIAQRLKILIDAEDKATKKMKRVKMGIMAVGAAAAAAAAISVKAFAKQEKAEKRLAHLTEQITDATEGQIQALKNQASALQEVGVIGDEVVIMGQSQLATFGLTTKQIESLTPALMDMAVAAKGANVKQEDLKTTANALGRAIDQGYGALTRYGISLSEAQKEMYQTANRMERIEMLSEILEQNFGGLNEAIRDTATGSMAALQNSIGDLSEKLGEAVYIMGKPFMSRLNNFVTGVNEAGSEVNNLAIATNFMSHEVLMIGQTLATLFQSLYAAILKGANAISLGLIPGLKDLSDFEDEVLNQTIKGFGDIKEEYREMYDSITKGTDEMASLAQITESSMDTSKNATEEASNSVDKYVDKIDNLSDKLYDLMDIEQDRRDRNKDYAERLADAYVEQEQNLKNLQSRMQSAEGKERLQLEGQYFREKRALAEKGGFIEDLYPSQVREARRTAGMTEFGRTLENIYSSERAARTAEKERIYNLNFDFKGANVSNMEELKNTIIDALNRQSQLAMLSGD